MGAHLSAIAWVLNLDADVELAASARGAPVYSPTDAVRAAMAPHVRRLAATLLGPADVLIDETSPSARARGLAGRAFCPTPRAIALLLAAGAEPEPHPPLEVLREVNGRAFCAGLGQTLPGAAFVHSLEAAVALLVRTPSISKAWRIKRAFGMAGRGQRNVAPGELSAADLSFLRSGVAEGGVQIEPSVAIVSELGIHGLLARDGTATLGRMVSQQCDAHGQWLASGPAIDVDALLPGTASALLEEARLVAVALHAAAYFGPFGVDSFVYRDLAGAIRLQPRSEVNARYSMGFSAGFL